MRVHFCPACGRLNLADFLYCPYCGVETGRALPPDLETVVDASFSRMEKGPNARILEEFRDLEAQLSNLEADMDLLLETGPGRDQGRGV